jgi:hypothetical protein
MPAYMEAHEWLGIQLRGANPVFLFLFNLLQCRAEEYYFMVSRRRAASNIASKSLVYHSCGTPHQGLHY